MPLYRFGENDIFRNRVKTHPRCHFLINNGQVAYNKEVLAKGVNDSASPRNVTHVPQGHISLYEMNVDRNESAHTFDAETGGGVQTMIFPFTTKAGNLTSFKTVSTSTFQRHSFGDMMTGSYPLSSSIAIEYHNAKADEYAGCMDSRPHIKALRNTLQYYSYMSPHFSWVSSGAHGTWNKSTEQMALVTVPSIFYGSSIKKGTVDLRFYITGSLVGQLKDVRQNGELIQVLPDDANKGKVAGVVLYNEGFMALTGSWNLHGSYTDFYRSCPDCRTAMDPDHQAPYNPVKEAPKWVYWGTLGNPADKTCNADPADPSVTLCPSSSWSLEFKGTNYVPVLTMLAHAKKGELNHSNNPTYVDFGQDDNTAITGRRTQYFEKRKKELANVVKSYYTNTSASFAKTTYISKVGIYDEDKNLIAVAKVATPVKKTEDREYTFKIKLDF